MATGLFDQIKEDLVKAQKERNSKLLAVLRLVISELNYKAIDAGTLSDDLAVQVLQKEAKKRQESIDIYTKVGDAARADQEKYELEIINTYLPQMMNEAEISAEIDKAAASTGKRGGMLIGEVKKILGSKADGAIIARIVMQKYSV